ncbi:MAG: TlpA family protein disulfide reductase, partial [Odoribacter sp.]|nr:TlpA family protein disulfide reductase [Odoribacter sp.]
APSFSVRDRNGREVTLERFRGKYLYITVWATWCVPCKSELPYLDVLQKEYRGKNIRFLTIAIGDSANQKNWRDFLAENRYAGLHTFADAKNEFNKDYMIISVPRFILIDPDGIIIDANAPRPSGQIRLLLDEQGL